MADADDAQRAIEAVWKIEAARLIAGLARFVRDLDRAEDLAQHALVSALEKWPASGVPKNPGAWLMQTAKNRAVDMFRKNAMADRKESAIVMETESHAAMPQPDDAERLDDDVNDDLLRLVFTSCHPVLPADARVALTLKLVAGLTTDEIARAFLTPVPTVAQRIVRAKKTIAEAQVPYEVPRAEELVPRLASVLEVVYLVFNEGYSATAGDDWMRPALCEDALRLGRILATLMPIESEVHGLVALMELQASRIGARTTSTGAPILLADQNRARWNQLLIRRGLAALQRGDALAAAAGDGARGRYVLEASIAACHARARTTSETDWVRIAALYAALVHLLPSPVVELNRAVAVAMAFGPASGLAIVDELASEPSLSSYHLLPAVRADFLAKLGRTDDARAELERAASLTENARERDMLLARARSLAS